MSKYIRFTDAVKVMACEMMGEAQSQGYETDSLEDFIPEATAWMLDAPTIRTKQIKYYDDDEHVWKIGRVIVDG